MVEPALPALAGWESFYVIVGSSAAALTGLMFVVIALGAEARALGDATALDAYATPTILHFCAVLLLAAFVTMPRQTAASLRACVLACAVTGLAYAVRAVLQARRQQHYKPVLSDWIWHGVLPVAAYAGMLAGGIVLRRSPGAALYVVAATALLLLYIGIHNAWDAAVWMAGEGYRRRVASPPAAKQG